MTITATSPSFELSEDLRMLRDSVRTFADQEIVPGAAQRDAKEEFPTEVIRRCAELGLLGIAISEEHGGTAMGNLALAVVLEELNRADASVGVTVSVHNSLVAGPIQRFGSPELKSRYLPKLATGEILGAYALTEAEAGSDSANLKLTAERRGDRWVLNGTKFWITTGDRAGLVIVFGRTDTTVSKAKGITAFVVDSSSKGFRVGKKEPKCGIRSSSTVQIHLDDVEVPDVNRLGERNEGFRVAMDTLDGGRIGIAAQALGIHRACLEASVKYAKERIQFGKPIGDFQAIQWKLADMATDFDAGRLLVHRAAWLRDRGEPCTQASAMAKSFTSRAANRAADDAVQIHGGAGYTKDFAVERYFRDARITEIYEGVTDIQRLVVARSLLR
ncbi:MAG TPA: acyl-CoA dehydrogenase family protein [Planctomycetota bacterium]|nr:acyl-CoA dehydrogenase family protein [Planctomycetota bacterium]